MAQEVRLPSGETYRFPDGMSKEEMIGAIQQHRSASEPPAQPAADLGGMNDMGMPQGPMPSGAGIPLPSAQTALDLTIQGLLTAGGMAAGSPAGPLGSATLSGAGAAAGKRIARDLGSMFGFPGSEEYPSTTESVVDAGMGAAGPAVSAVAKPLARGVAGVNRKVAGVLDKLHKGKGDLTKAAKEAADEAEAHAARMGKEPFGSAVEMATGKSSQASWEALKRQAQSTGERFTRVEKELRERILKTIDDTGHLPKKGGDFIAALQLVSSGDPVSAAAIFGAGRVLSKARMKAAKVLLNDEAAVAWMSQRVKGGITPSGLLTSLSGLAAQRGIAPESQRAISALQGEAESDGMRDDRDALERMMDGER